MGGCWRFIFSRCYGGFFVIDLLFLFHLLQAVKRPRFRWKSGMEVSLRNKINTGGFAGGPAVLPSEQMVLREAFFVLRGEAFSQPPFLCSSSHLSTHPRLNLDYTSAR